MSAPVWSPAIHNTLYTELLDWARHPAPRTPVAVFLHGEPGVGKTTLAHRIFNDAGLRAVECNASQFRHKAAMSELIEPLLNSTNVSDFFRPEGHRAMGIILDEIDGMSAGDEGGLNELVRILRNYHGPNAIICISNEWQEKRYQPLMKICLCRRVNPPALSECAAWMETDIATLEPLWQRHHGDLRKIVQWKESADSGHGDATTDITQSITVQELVLRLLSGNMDLQEEHELENNDLNLAGLHLHETLPDWIREHYGRDEHAWRIYSDCLSAIATSDRQDYYTFFHQHWSLFPLSFQCKLQAVNHRLFVAEKPTRLVPPGRGWKYQYTSVLSRQSWLYNQFGYLCEVRDLLQNSPLRDGGLESALWLVSALNSKHSDGSEILSGRAGPILRCDVSVPKERVQRWLRKLEVPPVPPCPTS